MTGNAWICLKSILILGLLFIKEAINLIINFFVKLDFSDVLDVENDFEVSVNVCVCEHKIKLISIMWCLNVMCK